MPRSWFPLAATIALLSSSVPIHAADAPTAAPGKVSYYKDVRPIFQQNCQGCHQPAKMMGGYLMTEFAGLRKAGDSGEAAVVPGNPAKSHLLKLIRPKNGKTEMPKDRPALTPAQVDTIARWIADGATNDTPASAKAVLIDADHPPVYRLPPVVTALEFSPDGKTLAVAGYHEILLHKADGSKIVGRLVGLSERVQAIAFSPDGKWLAAAAGDPGRFGEVQIWEVEKQRLKLSVPVTYDTVYGVSWSPDGKRVAFGCSDNTVRAIDATTGEQVLQMGTHSDWVLDTVFSQDGQHLASVGRDMSMKLTEVPTQRFVDNVTSITPGALKGGLMTVDLRPMKTKKMAKVPSDTPKAKPQVYDELLIGGSDGTPRLYKMHREEKRVIGDDSNKVRQYEPMTGRISSATFSRDGTHFAAASSLDGKGEVRVYETDTGKKVDCAKITGPAYAVAWRPDGKVIASSGFDGKVWLQDPATGKLIKEFLAVPLKKVQRTASR